MRIVMLGINHRTAPVELRERLALNEQAVQAALANMRDRYPAAEAVVLSTCNRTEIYLARPIDDPPTLDDLHELLATRSDISRDQLETVTIHREQEQAVRHLFRVATGIDSMILGEPQILGQVKRAYETAVEAGAVGPVLHRIFQQAIAAAKHARQATGIGRGQLSVASVAVDFARQIFEDFSDKTILSIGAGTMTKTMLSHLADLRPKRLWLVNRSLEPAQVLWDRLNDAPGTAGGPRSWQEMDDLLVEADIVLTSTASAEPILTADHFKPLLRKRRNRPIFIVDIAVPRDVEAKVGAMNNVYLYNIDDLQSVVARNFDQRAGQVEHCEAHLAEAVDAAMRQVRHRDIGQLIRQLRERLHTIGDQESQRTVRKLTAQNAVHDPDELDRLLDEHTQRLINKILHIPLSQLGPKDGDASLGFYAAALRRLFDLDDPANAEKPAAKEEKMEAQAVEVEST